ncbi:MAG: hypothetical protein MK089_11005, partial [Phycisphaerales bacterium]|nr:hypothetical protein [Phycisphaerales bacterium]
HEFILLETSPLRGPLGGLPHGSRRLIHIQGNTSLIQLAINETMETHEAWLVHHDGSSGCDLDTGRRLGG